MRGGELRFALFVAGVGLATCAALFVGAGHVGLAVLPVALTAAAWALWRLPLRYPALLLFALAILVENPGDQPAAGLWQSPLYPLGRLVYENLNKATGIASLRFAVIDLGILALLALTGARVASGAIRYRGASCLTVSALLAFAALVGLEAWGLLRGGSFKNSLWQIRQLGYLPLLTLAFQTAFRGRRDRALLGGLLLLAAVFKTGLGLYFLHAICRPQGIVPPYVTTHGDTVLFVAAVMIALTFLYERRTPQALLLAVGVVLVVGEGIIINDRRLAHAALIAGLVTGYLLIPRSPRKRALGRVVLCSLPFLIAYGVVGWRSAKPIFSPVQTVRSMFVEQEDRSTDARDIENYNLTRTMRGNLLLGTGFGHEYAELNRADDISQLFEQYRYIPHNSLLGLWAFSGLVGFTLLWMPLLVAVFLAARSYRRAARPVDRAAALTAISVVIVYALQAYGDMGLQSWEGLFITAAALGVAGRLADETGAWPRTQACAGSTARAENQEGCPA